MQVITCNLSDELDYIELIPLSDIHYGDANCDLQNLKSKVEYIKSHKNAYCLLNGDLLDNAIKQSVGDVYSQKQTPTQQLEFLCNLFEPIKNKILAVTLGNHEYRTWKYDGIDLTKLFCLNLGIDDKYAKESAMLFLRFGKKSSHYQGRRQLYSIYMTHGSGGGRKEGAKAIRLADMASIIDADIYIHSHTHLPMIMKQAFYRSDTRKSSVKLVTKLFVNTASNLKYGGYGEMGEFKPSSTDTPHIFLSGKEYKMNAKL